HQRSKASSTLDGKHDSSADLADGLERLDGLLLQLCGVLETAAHLLLGLGVTLQRLVDAVQAVYDPLVRAVDSSLHTFLRADQHVETLLERGLDLVPRARFGRIVDQDIGVADDAMQLPSQLRVAHRAAGGRYLWRR